MTRRWIRPRWGSPRRSCLPRVYRAGYSDANLASYGISPRALAEVLLADDRVNSYAVFIANKAEADGMKRMMPSGRAHTVLDMREMPRLFRQIFASAVIRA